MTSPDAPAPGEDPVAQAILDLLDARGVGKSISPEAAARAFAAARAKKDDPPDLWRRYLNAVRQQALHCRQGIPGFRFNRAFDGRIFVLN